MEVDGLPDGHGAGKHSGFSGSVAHSHIVPDVDRVIAHFDVDCFYAQVEELRNPSLKGSPLGVTQKYLIVTSNYAARSRGVSKLMGIKDAQAVCPEIHLVSGEDLTPYRQASKAIWSLLQKFGPVQRGGMDEAFVDITAEVKKRIVQAPETTCNQHPWRGHVCSGDIAIVSDSKYRPQDLRAVNSTMQQVSSTPAAVQTSGMPHVADDEDDDDDALMELVLQTERSRGLHRRQSTDQDSTGRAGDTMPCIANPASMQPPDAAFSNENACEVQLRVGSAVALEARQLISKVAGFRTSAGIACNKLLAKLVSGVGFKMTHQLRGMGITTVQQLRKFSEKELLATFGAANGHMLAQLALGKDDSAVVASGAPKSITCEDSFKSCSSFDAVTTVVNVVAPDLAARVVEEFEENQRWPKTLTIKWRYRANGFKRSGTSTPVPPEARPGCSAEQLVRLTAIHM